MRIVTALPIEADNAALRGLLMRALNEAWSAPSILAPAVHRADPARPGARAIARAAAGLAGAAARDLPGGGPCGSNDPLLLALMSATVVCNAALEKFLVGLPLCPAGGGRSGA